MTDNRNARPLALAAAAAVSALALLAAACSNGGDSQPDPGSDRPAVTAPDPEGEGSDTNATEAPTTTELLATTTTTTTEPPATTTTEAPATTTTEAPGPPHVAELAWGNFALADRIAAKLAAGETLNFVLSLTAVGEDSPAASFGHGWSRAAAEIAEQHGVDIDTRVIGPHSADAEAQAATIESLVASADIDCLAVQAANPRLLDDAIDAAVDAGVPVFAVSGDSPDSKRFAFYGIDAHAAGYSAGQLVGQWAADGGILVRRAAVLTGDAGKQSHFDMMRGFVDGLLEIHSGVEFVNGPADVRSFGFEPVAVYNATEAWVLDNLDVDIVFHTDAGVEALAEVMADQLLYGDMYAVGFHMTPRMADYIRERLVVASMAQGLAEQARRAGQACGDFLLGGVHDTGHVVSEPLAVTRDNVDDTDWALPENR